jgi:CheY-like chemotaxis protein
MQLAVAILGFGEFERDALSFCVRSAPASDVDYVLCEQLDEADLVVADADAPGVIARIVQAARTPRVVFVGKTEVAGAPHRVPRPIDPARVLRCLDEMAADLLREQIVSWAAADESPSPAPDPRISTKAKVRRAVRSAQQVQSHVPMRVHALVLEANDDDRATLTTLLGRFGFVVHQAQTPAQASELLQEREYAAAFLGVAFDGRDLGAGIELCRRVKETPSAPALIVVTEPLHPSDHVRARLVGADDHLTKPLARGDVARSLERCDVVLPADARRT